MKRALVAFWVVLLITINLGFGQSLPPQTDRRSEAEVVKTERARVDALLKKDVSAYDRILADDFTMTNASGQLLTKSEILTAFKSGPVTYQSIKNDDVKVRIYGDTAVVIGLTTTKEQYRKNSVTNQHRFTRVYVKEQQGRWQLVAAQSSRIAP